MPAGRPPMRGAVRLRSVLDHAQAVLGGDRAERVHVGALAVEVHRHQNAGCARRRGGDGGGIEAEVVVQMSAKRAVAPDLEDRVERRHEGERDW